MSDDRAEDLAERASLLVDNGRYAEALPLAGKAVSAAPGAPMALRVLASALSGVGRHSEAVTAARSAVAADPDDPSCLLLLAYVLGAADRSAEALNAARAATARWPHLSGPWHAVAAAAPDGPERVEAARRAVRLAPMSSTVHNTLGLALLAREPDAARGSFATALSLDPTNAAARSNLALVSLRGKRAAEAAEGFLQAVRLDPRLDLARNNLDLAVTALLRKALLGLAILLFVCVLILGDLSGTEATAQPSDALGGVRVLWFLGLASGAVLAVRSVVRFSAPLRGYLLRAVRSNWTTAFWALVVLAFVVVGSVSFYQSAEQGADNRIGLLRTLFFANVASWISRRRRAR